MKSKREVYQFEMAIFIQSRITLDWLPRFISYLEEEFDFSFEEASDDYETYRPSVNLALSGFFESNSNEKILSIQSKSHSNRMNISIKKKGDISIRVNLIIDNQNYLSKTTNLIKFIQDKVVITNISSMQGRIKHSPEKQIRQDRSILGPSALFGSGGTEWYALLSPEKWQSQYDLDILLDAPCQPKLLENNYIEWYLYDDPLQFDAEKARANRIYLGEHRKNKPIFPLKSK